MRDVMYDHDELYRLFPVPARLERAEHLERLATESWWPVRQITSLLLAIQAVTGPPGRRMVRSVGRVARAVGHVACFPFRVVRAALGVGRVGLRTCSRIGRRVAVRRPRTIRTAATPELVRRLQAAIGVVAALGVLASLEMGATAAGRPATGRIALATGQAAPSTVPPAPAPRQAPIVLPPPTPLVTPAPTTTAPPQPPNPAAAARRDPLPVGKGMWLYMPSESEGGDPARIVARAKAAGLTHLYVRTGSSYDGFNAAGFLDQILPLAHAAGLRVIGWDFPYLKNADDDVSRAMAAISHTTATGHRLDGFAADIEVGDGVNLTPGTAMTYGTHLRQRVGPDYPLIATVPRPSAALTRYPFAEAVAAFDAIAPMVYWMGDDPAVDLANTVAALRGFGKPIIPVGQAYDASGEGGPPGVPSRAAIQRFIDAADKLGTIGVSFWSWQGASAEAWDAVRDAPQFVLGTGNPTSLLASQLRCYQALLASLGYSVALTGVVDRKTLAAIHEYQAAASLSLSAALDSATQLALLTPVQVVPLHP
jgi:hypothetical protein